MNRLQRSKIYHITETEYKLKEAKYFISLLSRNKKNSEQFDFLLNAFVNSARSITWVMRAEFSKIPEWVSWFNAREVKKSERYILDLFNSLRVSASKKESLKTYFLVGIKIPENKFSNSLNRRLERLSGKKLLISIKRDLGRKPKLNPKKLTFSAYLADVRRGVIGFTEKDILQLCGNYLAILDNLVKDCIRKFSKYITTPKTKSSSHQLVKLVIDK